MSFKGPRFFAYALTAVIPPLALGLAVALSTISAVMIHEEPKPLPSAALESAQKPATGKLRAIILLSQSGSETLETLGAYEALGASGEFDVKTAAAHPALARTTSDLAILPDLSLEEAREGDLLVIPSPVDSSDTAEIAFLKRNAVNFRAVLVSGEAARLAAQAQLLNGKRVTTHFLALEDLRPAVPSAHWITGPRALVDGKLVTTAGLSATLDGTFDAVALLAGAQKAAKAASAMNWNWQTGAAAENTAPKPSGSDEALRLYRAGYDWDHRMISVLVYPGESELALAAALDIPPRADTLRAQSISIEREIVTTRHGLRVVAAHGIANAATDLLLVPSGSGGESPLESPVLKRFLKDGSIELKSFFYDSPGASINETLDLVAQLKGEEAARLAAELLLVNPPHPGAAPSSPGLVFWLILRPLLIAFLGLYLCRRIDVRLSKLRSQGRSFGVS